MTDNIIITIGREFGSGGHEIAERVASRLGIPLYDNNLIEMAAKELKITEKEAAEVDETALSSFLSSYLVGPGDYVAYMNGEDYMRPLSERVYRAQSDIIRELAKRGPCVIVGRCADFILQECPNLISVFIGADKEDRIKRIMNLYNISEKKAAEKIKKTDRERRYYYETNVGYDWGSPDTYQLFLNVSLMGMDKTVGCLAAIYREMEKDS